MGRTRLPGAARRAVTSCAIALLAASLTAGLGPLGAAADESPRLAAPAPRSSVSIPLDGPAGKVSASLAGTRGGVSAFVELAATAAVDAYNNDIGRGRAAAKAAGQAARTAADGKAQAVLAQLRGKDRRSRELFRTSNAVPGVAVQADAATLRELAASPEVVSIKPLVPKTITNAGAAQLTRVVQSWRHTGALGRNIRIGVIDTGIDYTHADFGGPGTRAAFDAVDHAAVPAGLFPSAKVVGGTDFVGDGYDASDPAKATPIADPNPIDCNGHGTHVAGTAAGFGVTADGKTFTGDYAALTRQALDEMKVGPGMAPKALLYALKVFGCDGSTDVVAQAMDWALDPNHDGDFSDHLDVVNMSLGSEYGAPDDPENAFVRKLVEGGVLPVVSAGNSGDLYDVGGAPGSAPEALTVASSRDSFVLRDAADVTTPTRAAGIKPGQYSVNYTGYDTLELSRPVVKLTQDTNTDGCQPFSTVDAAAVKDRLAWLEWDDRDATRRCGSAARANNAQAAGAAGVLLSSAVDNFAAGIAGNDTIPMFQLTASATAQVRPALDAGTLQVRLSGRLRASLRIHDTGIEDTPSSFTSRGVRSAVKPDVAAPGDTIASARVGSGDGVSVNSGTSMAAPHAAGIAALLRGAHPDWSPAEVKAALMTTAGHDVHADPGRGPYGYAPNRVGAGRVDALAALDNTVLAHDDDQPSVVSVGFGVVEVPGPVSLTKTIKVVNRSTAAASYDLAYEALTAMPGVRLELDRGALTVGPRGMARVMITLKIDDPAQLRKTADPTVEKLQNYRGSDLARQFLADVSGRVVFTPTSGATVPLRLPIYAAPKPVADVDAPRVVRVGDEGSGTLTLSGRGLDQGAGDQRYQSLVSAFELQGRSPRLPRCSRLIVSRCAPNQTARGGDLRYVGVASTAPAARQRGTPADAMIGFGIATWDDWYNVGSNTQPVVDVDTGGGSSPDFEVRVVRPAGTDLLLAATTDLSTGATVDVQPVNGQLGEVDTNVFDTNVIVLPVRLRSLGIDAGKEPAHRLSYRVRIEGSYARSGGVVDALDAALSFDPLRPRLWVQAGGDPALCYVAQPGTALVVNRDRAAPAENLLLLHHHNANHDRTEVVRVLRSGPIVSLRVT